MASLGLFEERITAGEGRLFTRGGRGRSALRFLGFIAAPLFALTLFYLAFGLWAGLGVFLAALLAFYPLVRPFLVGLWRHEALVLWKDAKEGAWRLRSPFQRSETRFAFTRVRRVEEITLRAGPRDRALCRVELHVQGLRPMDLGTGPIGDAEVLAGRLAALTGAPRESRVEPSLLNLDGNSPDGNLPSS